MYLSPLWGFGGFAFAQGLLSQNHKKTDTLDISPYHDDINPELPKSVSFRSYIPMAGEQGEQGTCVGWALANVQTIMKAIDGGWKDNESIVNSHRYSSFFPYLKNKNSLDNDCKLGIDLADGLKTLLKIGNLKDNEFPKDCERIISFKEIQNAQKNKIQSYTKIIEEDDSQIKKINAIKQALYTKQPIIAGLFHITESFKQITGKDFWQPTQKERENRYMEKTGHALVVIGYDDLKYGGSFLLYNSWGKDWGDEGTLWVKYEDFTVMCQEAYTMVLKKENSVKFSANVSLVGYENQKITFFPKQNIYATSNPMYENDYFQIHIQLNQPLYVYAFGTDLTEKNSKIFPKDLHTSAYFNDVSRNIIFPKRTTHWVLDDVKGKDYVCVLFSNEPLNFNEFLEELTHTKGDIYEKIKNTLGKKMQNLETILNDKTFDGININQQTLPNNKVKPIIIEIEHK